ncbi:hypothetical protein FRC12_009322 [Ceratobasidium sp. 428]|nr:hypothetical protein FRC12_009322 [Ceratobasidium sp. 428]
MSGGVDSSVTAALLAKQDYDLSAVFMRNWDMRDESGSDVGCEWEKDWEDVQRVCRYIGVPRTLRDFSKEYWNRVFTPALDSWSEGRTPNPDVFCNREIKFGSLFDHIAQDSQTFLATGTRPPSPLSHPSTNTCSRHTIGHYAQITHHLTYGPRLTRAIDRHKDQTYYLSSVSQSKLAQTLFPIGHLTKPQLRQLASEMNLPTAERSESMGLCFVGERGRFSSFLSQYIPPKPGPILLHPSLSQIGTHQGLYTLTIGQNARVPGQPKKMFVARKRVEDNSIIVVDSSTHPALMCTSVRLRGWKWISENMEELRTLNDTSESERASTPAGLPVLTQIRHRMEPVAGTLYNLGDTFEIRFAEPLHGVAAGQVGAAWDGEWCLGCGEIESTVCLE